MGGGSHSLKMGSLWLLFWVSEPPLLLRPWPLKLSFTENPAGTRQVPPVSLGLTGDPDWECVVLWPFCWVCKTVSPPLKSLPLAHGAGETLHRDWGILKLAAGPVTWGN